MIGEHTAKIMIDLLGVSRSDLIEGFDQGVFWPESTPPFEYVQKSIGREAAV